MHTPVALLEFTGKVLLRTASFGLAGDLTEVLPQVAQEVWTRWSKERSESQRRAEIEALIQTPAAEIRQAVAELVGELAGERSQAVQKALVTYLGQVPDTIRHSFRRPADPEGTTVPAALPLARPDALLPFLPTCLPLRMPPRAKRGVAAGSSRCACLATDR